MINYVLWQRPITAIGLPISSSSVQLSLLGTRSMLCTSVGWLFRFQGHSFSVFHLQIPIWTAYVCMEQSAVLYEYPHMWNNKTNGCLSTLFSYCTPQPRETWSSLAGFELATFRPKLHECSSYPSYLTGRPE